MPTTNFIDGVTPIVSAWLNDADKATYTNKDYGDDLGAVNAYVANLVVVKAAYVDGMRCDFSTSNANTGAATLNVNGLGAIPIKNQGGVALEIGQIRANTIMSVAYNSATAVFEVLNASAADATAKAAAAQAAAQASAALLYLPLAGNAAQVVSVAAPTANGHAVRIVGYANFSVSAGVLTVHKQVGMTLTRSAAGTFPFTFTVAQPDANWTCAINQSRSQNFINGGNYVTSKTVNGAALLFVENNAATDPLPTLTNASSIIIFAA